TFAPAGGPNTNILNNVRGFVHKSNGNLLVTTGSEPNIDCIAEFDQAGNYLGNFIDTGAGGLDSPFDVLYRPDYDDYLVSAFTSDAIHRYDATGNYIEDFASNLNSVEQLNFSIDGNILCAGYSDNGIFEFSNDGTLVGFYPGVNGIRGVYELPGGEMLVTDGMGVHRFSRDVGITETLISGVSARFINFIEPVFTSCEHMLTLYDDAGDGWNGATLDVFVGGIILYQDLTLDDGFGPVDYILQVVSDSDVEFVFTPGIKPIENYYKVFDHIGDVVFDDGLNGTEPIGGSFIANCDAIPMGQITGTISEMGISPLEGVKVSAGDYVTFSLADGTYALNVATGAYDVTAELLGYIPEFVHGIVINQNDFITIDFSLSVVPPFTVPFAEQWNNTSFDDQLWSFNPKRGNWEVSISSDYGNPAPGASFNWSPSATDYSYTLMSYDIDATGITDEIALQFDIFLSNYSTATVEGLELFVVDDTEWYSIGSIDNQKGSFPFSTKLYNISDYAAGKIIRIGFHAFGENSFNINGWGLDNILVVEPVTISGLVSEFISGTPVPGAEITFGSYDPVSTNKEGRYTLIISPGTYDANISKSGYNNFEQKGIEILDDLILDFQLTSPTFEPDKLAIVESLRIDETGTQDLVIENNGDGPVTWYASTEILQKEKIRIPKFKGIMNHGKGEVSDGKAPAINTNHSSTELVDLARGSVAWAFEMYPGHDLINLNTDDPGTYLQQIPTTRDVFAADFDNEGNYYAIDNHTAELYIYDPETGIFSLIGPSIAATDLAFDKSGNVMYAVDYADPTSELYRIDLKTGTATWIGNCGEGLIISMACDGNGSLWGFDVNDDNFYFINKLNGSRMLIGPVGFDGNYAQSMAWDPETDNIYMAALNHTKSQGELRIVDKHTGGTLLIGTFPGGTEVTGFGFPAPYDTWVSFSPTNGIILPGESSETITFSFDATGLEPIDIRHALVSFTTYPWVEPVNLTVALGTGQQLVDLFSGWSCISTYKDVDGMSLEFFNDNILGGAMSIMVGKNGFYWPEQHLNTIGNWNSAEGYKIKMGNDGYMFFGNTIVDNMVVDLEEGLSYMPMLSGEPIDAMILFEEVINNNALEFVFDIYTGQVLWPKGGLIPPNPSPFILKDMFPGVGYLIQMNVPSSINFNLSEFLLNAQRTVPKLYINNHWNQPINTGAAHVISIETQAFENLQNGDIIGAFNQPGFCCGATLYENNAYCLPLMVYADDETTEYIEGMASGEWMYFKVFRDGLEIPSPPVYNQGMPNCDGFYAENGLSSILEFKLESAGIQNHDPTFNIYPNPSVGIVNIETTYNSDVKLIISNAQGKKISDYSFNGNTTIDMTPLSKGVYFLKFTSENKVIVQKLIIE
nr:carboxypeptidase regulatory-like domain-containing protein [Bacteroidota bacterium]